MKIELASTPHERKSCISVMRELRLHLTEQELALQIERQWENDYRLVYVREEHAVVAVAGFRVSESLAWGKYLYIDDLVTSDTFRSKGYGRELLAWIREYATKQGCAQIHLDSGLQREDAHRFYQREGLVRLGYHFAEMLSPDK